MLRNALIHAIKVVLPFSKITPGANGNATGGSHCLVKYNYHSNISQFGLKFIKNNICVYLGHDKGCGPRLKRLQTDFFLF